MAAHPRSVEYVTRNDDEALIIHAQPSVGELRANVVQVNVGFSATPYKASISNAKQLSVHTMPVTHLRLALARQRQRSRFRSAGPAR